jgi:hypothetical protein
MLNSEKLAIAAHLHVLLRRKTGRVTDTEWMASNADYAAEVVRFARHSAKTDGHLDIGDWADKLALAMAEPTLPRPMANRLFGTPAVVPNMAAPAEANTHRYIRGIR